MKGPTPKDPLLRQRRNKAATRATLRVEEPSWHRAPSLPKRVDGQTWHALTLTWWAEVWHSPMAAQFLRADVPGLCRIAMLIDRFWKKPSVNLEARICASQALYGLTPLDRRRLEWIIERAEEAKKQRRVPECKQALDDPRRLLMIVP